MIKYFSILLILFTLQPAFAGEENPRFRTEVEDARGKMREILSRSEFRRSRELVLNFKDREKNKEDSWITEKLNAFREWLEKRRRKNTRSESRSYGGGNVSGWMDFFSGLGRIMLYVAVIFLASIIVYLIYRLVTEHKKTESVRDPSIRAVRIMHGVNVLESSDDEWAKRANEYMKAGNLREAIRALYISILVRLHRARLISFEQEKTNWEYVQSIPEETPLRGIFSKLTNFFDLIWYGQHEPVQNEYSEFSTLARQASDITKNEKNRV